MLLYLTTMVAVYFLICLKTAREQYFERLFGTPTGLNFEYTAMLYDFSFKRLDNITDFSQVSFSNMNSYIYEILTNREDNLEQHQLLYKKLSEILNVTL